MVRVSINGFGRIGRTAFRVGLTRHANELEFIAINTSGSMDVVGWAYLVNYDTAYRKFELEVVGEKIREVGEVGDSDPLIGYLIVKGKDIKIPVLAQPDPEKIPWGKYNVDVVIESTGKFITEEDAKKHAIGGAKRVVISAPPRGSNVQTFILGVNPSTPPSTLSSGPKGDGRSGQVQDVQVISNSSCTTNCVAPVAAVLHSAFGIEKAVLTTAHAYTDDQNIQDNSHKDLRRGRAGAANIVPTTTGAAVSTTETIPELAGLFDGRALRVPVICGSISDITAVLSKEVTVGEVNDAFCKAAQNVLYKGILAVSEEPLVSSDIIGRSESAIVDLPLTQVVGGNLVKIFAWYDNEWGYANRLIEQVIRVGKNLESDKAPTDPISLTFGQSQK